MNTIYYWFNRFYENVIVRIRITQHALSLSFTHTQPRIHPLREINKRNNKKTTEKTTLLYWRYGWFVMYTMQCACAWFFFSFLECKLEIYNKRMCATSYHCVVYVYCNIGFPSNFEMCWVLKNWTMFHCLLFIIYYDQFTIIYFNALNTWPKCKLNKQNSTTKKDETEQNKVETTTDWFGVWVQIFYAQLMYELEGC